MENTVSNSKIDVSSLLDHYSLTYLNQYWPEHPGTLASWSDNVVLMLAYQEAGLAIRDYYNNREVSVLDISTGPALTPLLGMISCVSEVQLSDFVPDNRRCLVEMPIEYWRNYVPMLVKLFKKPEKFTDDILSRLDYLRSAKPPVEVDLFKENPFPSSIDPHSFECISMHFVADGITKNEAEYLRCLGRATDMVRKGATFVMSATVDCNGWFMGDIELPSPNVSEDTIVDFLKSQGMNILTLSRSIRHPGLTYTGGWISLAASKL